MPPSFMKAAYEEQLLAMLRAPTPFGRPKAGARANPPQVKVEPPKRKGGNRRKRPKKK